MAHPRKPPYRRKNQADISYTDRVIANFVPNFVAMATRVGRGKMRLAAFDGPFPSFLDLSTSMTLNGFESPKKRLLVNFSQFLDAAHISALNSDEMF